MSQPGPSRSGPLWAFYREVRDAVDAANAGTGPHPYRSGDFMVAAEGDDIEITVRDVSEEDAVLIASELVSLGARARIGERRTCPRCGRRTSEFASASRVCSTCNARRRDASAGPPPTRG